MFKKIAGFGLSLAVAAALMLAPISDAFAQQQVISRIIGGGGTPALTVCGTTPAITGTDLGGTVTMGTGSPTGCVITFSQAYALAPHCVVTWIATPLASQSYVTSASAITLTQTGTSSNVVKFFCVGQN